MRKSSTTFILQPGAFLMLIVLALCFTVQSVFAAPIDEFPVPTTNSRPDAITAGPDGNMWFAEFLGNQVAKITPNGDITEYPIGGSGNVSDIAADGSGIWAAESASDNLYYITPDGTVTPEPITPAARARSLAFDGSGNLWFTRSDGQIGMRAPDGSYSTFPVPNGPGDFLLDMTRGTDGNMWFVMTNANKIAKITPTGTVSEYDVPTNSGLSTVEDVVAGPNGNMWYTDSNANWIGEMAPDGTIVNTFSPSPEDPVFEQITAGPDGNLWATASNELVRMTPTGDFSFYKTPTQPSLSADIAIGPSQNVWFTESAQNKVGRFLLDNLPPAVPEPTTTGPTATNAGSTNVDPPNTGFGVHHYNLIRTLLPYASLSMGLLAAALVVRRQAPPKHYSAR